MINEAVAEQHAEEAAFLWTQRDRGVVAPNFRLKELARWDERLEAHLDGLRIAGQFGWQLCEMALEEGEAGELFAAGVLAFGNDDDDRININVVLNYGAAEPALRRGLISALGWLPFDRVVGIIKQMLEFDLPEVRCVGIGGCAVHRYDPGQVLNESIFDPDVELRARALKACGELGRTDLVPSILKSLSCADLACRFFAAWSAARLGDRSRETIDVLGEVALKPGPYAERALGMALRVIDLEEAKAWQRELQSVPTLLRLAAVAIGVIGDPALFEDLIQLMLQPPVARAAGAAFSMITGIDLAYEDLDVEPPKDFESGPNESPEDENVALDADENYRWPGPDLVAAWWEKNENRFFSGNRYLCGKEITGVSLQEALTKGYQPQRAAAALELALRQPTQPLFEVRANGGQQLQAFKP